MAQRRQGDYRFGVRDLGIAVELAVRLKPQNSRVQRALHGLRRPVVGPHVRGKRARARRSGAERGE